MKSNIGPERLLKRVNAPTIKKKKQMHTQQIIVRTLKIVDI